MKVLCIGGDFDGQDIERLKDQNILKVNNAEEGIASEYYLQTVAMAAENFEFWFSEDIDRGEDVKITENIIRGK